MVSAYDTLLARLETNQGKLALIALASAALTTSTIFSAQALSRRSRRIRLQDEAEARLHEEEEEGAEEEVKDFTRLAGGKGKGKEGKKRGTSDLIIRESLARNYVFFGDEGMEKVRNSFVIVVGLGGVGSAAACMLVRSGVRKIRLIDFDQVSLSSLNRHATATLAQVGTPKVVSCADSFEAIAPWVEVDARVELFTKEVADQLLEGKPDYVLDCIDNIESKVDLIAYCHAHDIPVIASLGAGAKSDPSRIQISDISMTTEDPLARSVRRRLKLQGVLSGIPTVFSSEKPRAEIGLLPLPDEEYAKGAVEELSAMPTFRVRILPVLGPLPSMFGNAAAAYVLQKLAGFSMETLALKGRTKAVTTMHKTLLAQEHRLNGSLKIPITLDDINYTFEEIFRGRAVSPLNFITQRPSLMRWKKEGGVCLENLVLFDQEDGKLHEEHCLQGDEDPEVYWGEAVSQLVRKRLGEEARLNHYRI